MAQDRMEEFYKDFSFDVKNAKKLKRVISKGEKAFKMESRKVARKAKRSRHNG